MALIGLVCSGILASPPALDCLLGTVDDLKPTSRCLVVLHEHLVQDPAAKLDAPGRLRILEDVCVALVALVHGAHSSALSASRSCRMVEPPTNQDSSSAGQVASIRLNTSPW